MNIDPFLRSFVHKKVLHSRRVASLSLLTSQSLFSSSAVDVGTNLLLRVISVHSDKTFDSCLDVGCGYGGIGLSLAASGVAKQVESVDRDALAVAFTQMNAQENRIATVSAHTSLGLDDLERGSYDLIVSNLPGKAGPAVLRHILRSSSERLEKDGEFWGVVVNPLWPETEHAVDRLSVDFMRVEKGARHTAFGFRSIGPTTRSETVDSLTDVYLRDEVGFEVNGENYSVETSRGVAEFDGLNYSTKLVLEHLYGLRRERWDSGVVFNVGQGYIPIALRASGMAASLELADRDLLALRTAARNLQVNGLDQPGDRSYNQIGWLPDQAGSDRFELVVGTLKGDEPRETIEIGLSAIADSLAVKGTAVLAGGSTPITRMLKALDSRKDIRVLDRSRYRGSSAITLRKTG